MSAVYLRVWSLVLCKYCIEISTGLSVKYLVRYCVMYTVMNIKVLPLLVGSYCIETNLSVESENSTAQI